MAVSKLLAINGVPHKFSILDVKGSNITISATTGQTTQVFVISEFVYDYTRQMITLLLDGHAYKIHLQQKQSDNEEGLSVTVNHQTKEYSVVPQSISARKDIQRGTVKEQSKLDVSRASVNCSSISFNIKSPLAGRVNKILVNKGDFVKRGQPLVLIESMKMENQICSSSDAFIKTILIAQGNVVQPNQILIEFDNRGEKDDTTSKQSESKAI